jgi:hypothetical protein
MFHWQFVVTFLMHLQIKLHKPSCSVSLIMTTKVETNYRFHAPTILFYVVQKFALTKLATTYILLRDITTRSFRTLH